MKKLISLLLLSFCCMMACTPAVQPLPIPHSLLGRWELMEKQAAGIGTPGVWSAAKPAGQWMELADGGRISGTAFTDVTGYQLTDSVTLKLMAPGQTAGFYLFNYHLDTLTRSLYFYIRPANGGYCYEGCGGYRFGR